MNKKGKIEVIVGPMFAGKTEELIRRVKRAEIAEQNVIVFKHIIDDRYSKENQVITHNGVKYKCILVGKSDEILDYINKDTDIVAIDEAQFFDDDIPKIVEILVEKGIRVICSGLDMDFKKEPFLNMAKIMAMADNVQKLTAICFKCKGEANLTQRLINGKPAKHSDPVIMVGGKETYEARCRKCHKI